MAIPSAVNLKARGFAPRSADAIRRGLGRVFLGLWAVLALTTGAHAQPESVAVAPDQGQKVSTSAEALNVPISQSIPWPEGLQPDIDFWIRVYSEISTRQGFMHDEQNLSIVYATIVVPDRAPGSKERRAAIEGARERWQRALNLAAEQLGRGTVSSDPDVQHVLKTWGAAVTAVELRNAATRVRFQLGQADRFRAGIVRSGTWENHIARTLESKGLPKELASLPHVESSFEPTAYSKVGAAGLWQFMRSTGRLYMRIDDVVDERLDPFIATESAARLLQSNYRVLGSWPLAITAYNHGTAGMRRARDRLATDDYMVIRRNYRSKTFGFASRNFYPSFLAAVTIDRNPDKYFGPVRRAPEAVFREVTLPAYVELAPLASALEVDTKQLRELNPALRPGVWSGQFRIPHGYRLRLPNDLSLSAAQLQARIDSAGRHGSQTQSETHRIQKGETLSQIARRYGVSTQTLADLNGIRVNSVIRYGQTLKLPAKVEGRP